MFYDNQTLTSSASGIASASEMRGFEPSQVRRLPPLSVIDLGKVRLGGQGPCFRRADTADARNVKLGGQGPLFRPASIADAGQVRLGGQGPLFR